MIGSIGGMSGGMTMQAMRQPPAPDQTGTKASASADGEISSDAVTKEEVAMAAAGQQAGETAEGKGGDRPPPPPPPPQSSAESESLFQSLVETTESEDDSSTSTDLTALVTSLYETTQGLSGVSA